MLLCDCICIATLMYIVTILVNCVVRGSLKIDSKFWIVLATVGGYLSCTLGEKYSSSSEWQAK